MTCRDETDPFSCVVKRFVSSILFVAAVGILVCTIFSKQDTKSTPTDPTFKQINHALCEAGLGGGPDCDRDEVKCPADQVLSQDGSACVCAAGKSKDNEGQCCLDDSLTNNHTCCPYGKVADGNDCICPNNGRSSKDGCCPADQYLNGDECVESCPNHQNATENNVCCPVGQDAEGDTCVPIPDAPKPIVCPTGQVPNEDGKTCVCLEGLEKDNADHCCSSDRFWKTKGVCCPENAKSTNGGTCKCDDDNKVYNSTSNTCEPKHDAGTSKFQHTTILWALLGIIALICIFLLVLFFTRSDDKAAQGVVGPQGREKEADSDEVHGEYQFDHGRGEED